MASLFDLLQAGQLPQELPMDPWQQLEEIKKKQEQLAAPGIAVSEPGVAAPAPRPDAEAIPTRDVAPRPQVGVPYAPPAAPSPTSVSAVSPPPADNRPPSNPMSAGMAAFTRDEGLLPGIARLFTADSRENQTVRVLMAKIPGMDQETATTVARNPDMMKQILPQLFSDGGYTLKTDEQRRNRQNQIVAQGGPKFIPIPESGLFDTQKNEQVVSGQPKRPEAVKAYEYYADQERQAGRQPKTFNERELELRKMGAISVVMGGEHKESEVLGNERAQRQIAIRKEADKAYEEFGAINIMRQAMADPNFYSGVGAETFVVPIKQAIAAIGGDPNAAASMEVFRSQSNKLILSGIGGSLGTAISNADRDFIAATAARLPNTPAGNNALLTIMEKMARRKVEVADFMDQYKAANSGKMDDGFDAALRQWRGERPLFTAEDIQIFSSAAATPAPAAEVPSDLSRPKTLEEALKLPPGTKFIIPDGPSKGKVGTIPGKKAGAR